MLDIPRYLYNIATADKTITYTICIIQTFYTDVFGVTEFPSGYHVLWPLCGHLQTLTLCNHHEWQSLWMACCLLLIAGWLVIFPPVCLGLNIEFCDSNVIDHFLCDASPMMKISCADTWFIEQMVVAVAVLTDIGTFLWDRKSVV